MEKALGSRVAGVPAWALGTILAVAIIGFIAWRNHTKNKPAQGSTNDQSNPSGNAGGHDPNAVDPATGLTYGQEDQTGSGYPSTPIASYLAENPTNAAYPVGGVPQGLPAAVTNQQWARLVADSLLAKGDDPLLVEQALADYLNGKTLNAAESAVIRLGLTTFGSPPEGVLAPGTGTSGKPSAPTNLHAQDIQRLSIKLAWDTVSGADGYKIYASNRSGAWQLIGTNVGATATTFTHVALRPRSTHHYQVEAYNTNGSSPRSSTLDVTTTR
jgi:hypothetical protein